MPPPTPQATMHPRTHEVLDHLDRSHAELTSAIAAVPRSRWTEPPAPGRWSVAEVVEHLALVEARVAPLIVASLADAKAAGLGPERETSAVVPSLDFARLLDRSRPLAASEASQPRSERGVEAALAALESERATLRAAVLAADGLALGQVLLPHARLGEINLYQWLVFVGAHEARHAAQLREVGAALGGGEGAVPPGGGVRPA